MIIETKFSLMQHVYGIGKVSRTASEPCPICDGTGEVEMVKGGKAKCPQAFKSCHYGRTNKTYTNPWAPNYSGVVGQVRTESEALAFRDEDERDQPETKVQYMLSSTGVGSGTLWSESDLFATAEEAQTECDTRNGTPALAADAGTVAT